MLVFLRAAGHRFAIPVLCAVAGCNPPDSEQSANFAGDWAAAIDTLVDTIVVHTTAGSIRGRRLLVEQLRIGVVEGSEHETFGDVGALAVAANGDILIYDEQATAIRRYTSEGQYVGTIGRSGSGPGEYRGVAGMAVTADGRLVLNDFGNRRISVYTPEGEFLTTWVISQAIAERRPLYIGSTGRILVLDLAPQEDDGGSTEVLV